MKKTIVLSEVYGSDILRNRAAVKKVMTRFKSADEVTIDFKGISFVSQSFANELITQMRNKNIQFKFKNARNGIRAMIDVAFNKPKHGFKKEKIERIKVCG